MVLATHQLAYLQQCDSLLYLEQGRQRFLGPPQAFFASELAGSLTPRLQLQEEEEQELEEN